MPVLFALVAAFCNALNVVTQHIASIGDPGHSKGWRFVRYLLANPLWLFGWVALAGAFVFQALALHNGLMSVVQPLLVTELVFALVLRRVWIRQRSAASPGGRRPSPVARSPSSSPCPSPAAATPTPTSWPGSGHRGDRRGGRPSWACSRLRGSPARRAALLGAATSVLWALVAAFIKAMTDSLTQFGVGGMFTHWPIYALAVAGLAAELLNQAALHVGPLEHVAAVHRDRRPDRQHRPERLVFAETFTESVPRLTLASLALRHHVRRRRGAGPHRAGHHGPVTSARHRAASRG